MSHCRGADPQQSLPEYGASLEQGSSRLPEGEGVVIKGKTILCKTEEKGSEKCFR